MKLAILIVLLATAPAHADVPWRIKIDSLASGELVTWPNNRCGAEIADHVRRIVRKYPYIEVVDGQIAARIDEKKPVPAHRQVIGDVFVAFYDVTDTRTIAFTIRWRNAKQGKDGKDGTVPVEVSVIAWEKPGDREDPNQRIKGCRETWLGTGKLI